MESFWQQIKRFPRWSSNEWLGMGMMAMGAGSFMFGSAVLIVR